jgi:hypothetical protein
MKKILISLILAASLVAANAEAHGGGWNGHHHGWGNFWWGAAFGAALTVPFYYAYSRSWDPGPYYYYNSPPVIYANPPAYVQSQPVYVQSQPSYAIAAAQPGNAVTQTPSGDVIELGPANALPPVNSSAVPAPNGMPAAQTYAYPAKGQSPQQQANDRYECNRWAISESGYDPDLRTHRNPETGPAAYGRAFTACLEGHGYAVR